MKVVHLVVACAMEILSLNISSYIVLMYFGCRYDFARSDAKVVMTTFHWHAHSVAEVCFTSDGELEHGVSQ